MAYRLLFWLGVVEHTSFPLVFCDSSQPIVEMGNGIVVHVESWRHGHSHPSWLVRCSSRAAASLFLHKLLAYKREAHAKPDEQRPTHAVQPATHGGLHEEPSCVIDHHGHDD